MQLSIGDDGRGFDPGIIARAGGAGGEHLGLALMRERVEALGGTFSVASAVGQGTTVCAVLPVRRGGVKSMGKIRILIVDDHAMFRDGLRVVLEPQEDMLLAGEASDAEGAIRLAAELRPDVILMDLHLPGRSGVEATREIRASQSSAKVIALTMYHDDSMVDAMIQAGARGYVLKEGRAAELLQAIRAVAAGGAAMNPGVVSQVLEHYRQMAGAPAQRATGAVVGARCGFAAAPGRRREQPEHRRQTPSLRTNGQEPVVSPLRKLGVSSRMEAVAVALRTGDRTRAIGLTRIAAIVSAPLIVLRYCQGVLFL